MLAWVCHLARSLGDLVLYKAALLIPANFHVVSSFHLHLYFRLLQIMRYYFDTTLLCFFVLNKELNILSVFIFITLWRGRRRQEIWKMEARMFKPLAQRLIQSHQVSKRQKWNLWRSGRVLEIPREKHGCVNTCTANICKSRCFFKPTVQRGPPLPICSYLLLLCFGALA